MAKLFIIARKAAPSLCMSMKISPSEPSCVLAGAQVDLVAADDRLLGVALAPLGQALRAFARSISLYDDLLDDLLGEHGDPLGGRRLGQHLLEVLVVLDQRGRERLAELGAVAVERVRLDAERPGELVGGLAVADRRVVRHVDRLGDRAGDEALGGGHHADVALDREVAPAGLAAGVGAVEDRVVLGARCGAPSSVIVPQTWLLAASICARVKPRWRRRSKAGSRSFSAGMPRTRVQNSSPSVHWLKTKRMSKAVGSAASSLAISAWPKPWPIERGVVDLRRVAERAVADGVGDDLLDLGRACSRGWRARRGPPG